MFSVLTLSCQQQNMKYQVAKMKIFNDIKVEVEKIALSVEIVDFMPV